MQGFGGWSCLSATIAYCFYRGVPSCESDQMPDQSFAYRSLLHALDVYSSHFGSACICEFLFVMFEGDV